MWWTENYGQIHILWPHFPIIFSLQICFLQMIKQLFLRLEIWCMWLSLLFWLIEHFDKSHGKVVWPVCQVVLKGRSWLAPHPTLGKVFMTCVFASLYMIPFSTHIRGKNSGKMEPRYKDYDSVKANCDNLYFDNSYFCTLSQFFKIFIPISML